MAGEYINQHFVPVVYLKEFSVGGSASRKKSTVHYLSRKPRADSSPVKTENECCGDFFYSRQHAEKAEKFFSETFENLYGLLKQRIYGGTVLKINESELFLTMVSLYLRNPAFENRVRRERIGAYFDLEFEFVHTFLKGSFPTAKPEDVPFLQMTQKWRVKTLKAEHTSELRTSDNPVSMLTTRAESSVQMALMPVNPEVCVVAYDTDAVAVLKDTFSPEDEEALNNLQYKQAQNCAYSRVEFTPQVESHIRDFWTRHPRKTGFLGDDHWHPMIQGYGAQLSFLNLKS